MYILHMDEKQICEKCDAYVGQFMAFQLHNLTLLPELEVIMLIVFVVLTNEAMTDKIIEQEVAKFSYESLLPIIDVK